MYESEVKNKLTTDYLIYLNNANDLYKLEKNNKFSNSLILSLKYPDGLQKLYSIMSAHGEKK
jgi:hypothetical protein